MPLIRGVALLAFLALAGCSGGPTRYKTVVASPTGDVTWWGPSQAIADARARWYADPSYRVDANIPRLGYR